MDQHCRGSVQLMTLLWIVVGGLLMSCIALVGGLTTVLRPATLQRLLLPMVALAAGSLLGGAFFHLIPAALQIITPLHAAGWIVSGFIAFFGLEQFLHWHHCHRVTADAPRPMTYLILLGDALHNFLGGLAVASAFIANPTIGITAWLAAAAHEVPQELGDFGVLVHGGWPTRRALLWNFGSGLTFLIGALLAYAISWQVDTTPLMLFGAGNFIYIGASDLVPEIKAEPRLAAALLHLCCLVAGVLLLALLAYR
jgi:zinc and cadmium transporter